MKYPPVPNVLSRAPPKAIPVFEFGSKFEAVGFVHPRIDAIHELLSKQAAES